MLKTCLGKCLNSERWFVSCFTKFTLFTMPFSRYIGCYLKSMVELTGNQNRDLCLNGIYAFCNRKQKKSIFSDYAHKQSSVKLWSINWRQAYICRCYIPRPNKGSTWNYSKSSYRNKNRIVSRWPFEGNLSSYY